MTQLYCYALLLFVAVNFVTTIATLSTTTTITNTTWTGLWVVAASNNECDTSAGEDLLIKNSPGKVSSLAQCQQTCQDSAQCQSITFFGSGWCSHFSTPCINIKTKNGAVVLRLTSRLVTTATPITSQLSDKACNFNTEKYLQNSPGNVPSLEVCAELCVPF